MEILPNTSCRIGQLKALFSPVFQAEGLFLLRVLEVTHTLLLALLAAASSTFCQYFIFVISLPGLFASLSIFIYVVRLYVLATGQSFFCILRCCLCNVLQ